MTRYCTNGDYPPEHRRLLRDSIRLLPISEKTIQQAVQIAIARERRPRRKRFALKICIVLMSLFLLASSYWTWNGFTSADLSYGACIEMTLGADYSATDAKSAAGKIWKDLMITINFLQENRGVPPAMAAALILALDTQQPASGYATPFEVLSARLRATRELSPADATELTNAMCAGICAFKTLEDRDDTALKDLGRSLARGLRKKILAPAPGLR